MKCLLRLLCPFIALFSFLAGCNLFDPQAQVENLSPVDSMQVFHNLVNSYNTLDYEAFHLCLDSSSFIFIPEDSTIGSDYKPWEFEEETDLTFEMFNQLAAKRQIPPLILQMDTTYFSATDTHAFLHANYKMTTQIEGYETLGGGLELEIIKRGNYWYIKTWKDVFGDTIFIYHEPDAGDTVEPIDTVDTILPPQTDKDWSDFKVYFSRTTY